MFYANIFDPVLVLSQIVIMQCTFYLLIGLLVVVCHALFQSELSLSFLLDPSALHVREAIGWPPILAFLLVAPACSYVLVLVVGRAKKCLDFAATVYMFHFFCCLVFAGFPYNWEWWITNTLGLVGCVVLGEYLCMKKEMEYIPLPQYAPEDRNMVEV